MTNVDAYLDRIKAAFASSGSPAEIPMLRQREGRRTFTARLRDDGIEVSNLDKQPFLPWKVFEVAIQLMVDNNGSASKGQMQTGKLGDAELPLDSIEGSVAQKVYGLKVGESGFRRITPITGVLIWAGVCTDIRGGLRLNLGS